MKWEVEMRGGAYDGYCADVELDSAPGERLVAYRHAKCEGHITFDVNDPRIVLATAEPYKRVELNADEGQAVYEVGNGLNWPTRETYEEERELVGAGANADPHGPGTGEGYHYA